MNHLARTLLLIAFSVLASPARGEVAITTEGSPLTVRTAEYEARVAPDGCLTNLRVAHQELLAAGVAISRGSYFFQGGPLQLNDVRQLNDRTIIAESKAASVRYEFDEANMTWELTNKSAEQSVFFLVFAKDVVAGQAGAGPVMATPLVGDHRDLSLFTRAARLSIEGCDKAWGPWQGPHQVCQVTLAAGEKRSLVLRVAKTTNAERAAMVALWRPADEPDLRVYSPRAFQVVQRGADNHATVLLNGHTTTQASEAQYRVTGDSTTGPLPAKWRTVEIHPQTRSFEAALRLPAGGWYRLEVKVEDDDRASFSTDVPRFGVGEVFVGTGQSNSTNCGEVCTKQETGMVASFGGDSWKLADDPQLGVADRTQGGSFWPAFGDAMHRRYRVPIGVATTGFGGTSVRQWQPGGDLFRWTMERVHQLGPGGFRALLWHQGESDVGMPPDEYYTRLRGVISASRDQAGWRFPWFVAQTSYHKPERPRFEGVRSAQARLCDEGFALLGPDTDTLTGDNRDLGGLGIHFSPKGLANHGRMWAESVVRHLDNVIPAAPKSVHLSPDWNAEPWPAADELFHRDPHWLGGDAAGSIQLDDQRVAWLFADSFVAPTTPGERKGTTMVHSSIGIQVGLDPSKATFKGYWRIVDGRSRSFIPDDGAEYFWPGGRVLLDDKLLVFLIRARTAPRKMNFETTGSDAVLIENLDAEPSEWRVRRISLPQNSFRVLVGSASAVLEGEHVVAFSVADDTHDVFLVRWRAAAASAGDLSQPEWWAGADRGWVAQHDVDALPPTLFSPGQTEFTVHASSGAGASDEGTSRHLQVQFEGFPLSPIAVRSAASLTGPWSSLAPIFEPADCRSRDPGLMCYAAKAHPEQQADGLVLTYCSNAFDIGRLFQGERLYYPRFVVVRPAAADAAAATP